MALSKGAKWAIISVCSLTFLGIGGTILYTWGTLSYSYADGERVGMIQKFSQKGWVCKTWEGELSMTPMDGMIPEKFEFSVRDDSVVEKIKQNNGKKVTIYYKQHKGVPTKCFGETEYYIYDVKPIP